MTNESQSIVKTGPPAPVPVPPPHRAPALPSVTFDVQGLSVWFSARQALCNVSLQIPPGP